MYARLLIASFRRAPRRKLVALLVLVLGTGTVTGLSALAVSAGDAMAREFRSIGANLRIAPREALLPRGVAGVETPEDLSSAFLGEADLAALVGPGFFWRRNVTALTPLFPISARINGRAARLTGAWFGHRLRAEDGQEMVTGLAQVYPGWRVDGRWPATDYEVALGALLARRLRARRGGDLRLVYGERAARGRVAAILHAGGPEDAEAFAPLALVQQLAGRPGQAREALVSAITTPESQLARVAATDPSRLSPAERDRWYCTNYPDSIAQRIEETLPGVVASPIRRAVETEGRILARLNGLMMASAIAALLTAALGMLSTIATTLLERRREIGLLKALGAEDVTIAALFAGEGLFLGLIGGLAGWIFGELLGWGLALAIFGRPLQVSTATLPVALAGSIGIVLLATLFPVRAALRWDPVAALHGA